MNEYVTHFVHCHLQNSNTCMRMCVTSNERNNSVLLFELETRYVFFEVGAKLNTSISSLLRAKYTQGTYE